MALQGLLSFSKGRDRYKPQLPLDFPFIAYLSSFLHGRSMKSALGPQARFSCAPEAPRKHFFAETLAEAHVFRKLGSQHVGPTSYVSSQLLINPVA